MPELNRGVRRLARQGLLFAVLVIGLFSSGIHTVVEAADRERPVTGTVFQQRINQPLLVNRDLTALHDMLMRLQQERRAAILLDRRIDPGQLVAVDVQAGAFDLGIAKLVEPVAGVTVLGDTVFVGPKATASTLQTRAILSSKQLDDVAGKDLQRVFELSQRRQFAWELGAAPRDLVNQLATRYRLTIDNPERIPHDQWRAGALGNPNAIEGVLLIACQFDLDLEFVSPSRVRFVPQSENPVTEVEHTLRGMTTAAAIKKVQEQFPELTIVSRGKNKLLVTARHEVQQEIGVLLGNRAARPQSSSPAETPLARRRFTLRMPDRPFLELVQGLEKQGISLRRDEAALTAAGIDLNRRISLELENATIQQLLDQACGPVGLEYSISQEVIELRPAQRRSDFR